MPNQEEKKIEFLERFTKTKDIGGFQVWTKKVKDQAQFLTIDWDLVWNGVEDLLKEEREKREQDFLKSIRRKGGLRKMYTGDGIYHFSFEKYKEPKVKSEDKDE